MALTKSDTTSLWHAVEAFKDMVRAMRDMEGITPEQIAAEEAKLASARRALTKVNAFRKAQP
ncbi:MAG: hypothetical protein KKD97_16125 [Gammaproteobacteria bacterium]|nr:hypothetical protein [Gammaproteobacteria bacterium]